MGLLSNCSSLMGVLGGLFVLGAVTTRANATGALCGALVGASAMFCLWMFSDVNGYIYTAAGVSTCFLVGYIASLATGDGAKDVAGLTIHTLEPNPAAP